MQVTPQELLEMYKRVVKQKDDFLNTIVEQEQRIDRLEYDIKNLTQGTASGVLKKEIEVNNNLITKLKEEIENLNVKIKHYEETSLLQEKIHRNDKLIISKLKQICGFENDDTDNVLSNENTIGVEKTGDLNDYEYMSDGKRMCFQNYQTGNRVYACDELFSVLKNRMLRGE